VGKVLTLDKANINDCHEIHEMQLIAFKELLDKYQDMQTNPGAETIERVVQRMEQDFTDYYFITLNGQHIGAIRILRLDTNKSRISPMFILPEFQGKGYAQQVIQKTENIYTHTDIWELNTIKQESKLCHLYEKMGYVPTGKEEAIQDGMTIIFYEKHLNR
jgi:GNAT superfamily N-acetyltransferase